MLEWITLLAAAVAGFVDAPALVIPLAAFALMLDHVWGKAYRLRQHPRVPLSTKMVTYLVTGGIVALAAAWLAYAAGTFARSLAPF